MATSHAPVELGPAAFRALPPAAQAKAVIGGRTRFRPGEALRILIMLGRPRTCVPGLFAYGLGLAYAGVPSALSMPYTVLGGVLALLVGFSANLHNTYTDIEEDCRNLPGRMWLLYRFGRPRLLLVLVAADVFMAGAALTYGRGFFVYVVIGLIGLHQYSFRPLRMKARPLLGLYVFAQAVVGPFLIGWFSAGMRVPTGPVWAMLAFLFFWFVAKGLFKNVPDYDGDRAVGLRTSATVFPSRVTAARVAAAVTVLAYLALPLLVVAGASPPRVLFALPLTIVAAVQAWTLVRAADGTEANTVLRRDMVLSSAFLGVVLLLQAPTWTSVLLVVVGVGVIAGTDLLAMDSRRSGDAASAPPPVRPGPPRDPRRSRPATPQELFDRVAPRYDLFNSLLSGGSDRRWRRRAARLVAPPPPGGTVLDVATGTGSLAIAVADAAPDAEVTGCDINAAMLAVGEKKIAERGLARRVRLVRAPGEDLPFEDGSFDAVCIAFAIDDMSDRRRCAAEMTRVLRPGGRLVLLELAVPEQPVLRSAYLGGLAVMSLLGRARGMDGYRHLREEITTYRGADAIRALLTDVGLHGYGRTPLTGGIAVLHAATKPGGSEDAGQ
ncbi:ubiquinone/menaquinone biosynthesis methyltransferase [Actinomadura sp. DC4]|uniref:ubiquinone/menaquinone biosynthesis methyltransferase n=1 Tax=Actinomadura sp. DC4 TaxID=3055069 RepID=UPI0025B073B8|nr:ubiquinone/menaquinone biosynthesis methyltransferase [Actinomadura sp. DC4]MDN3351172.1 ubiquinone/menaquinone biosynthesis methyltransferase [Actinomadura sp. DC4]